MSSDYERVTNAIADVMFGPAASGRPVYTLPDPEVLSRILELAEVQGTDVHALASVVRSSLYIDDMGLAPFRWQADAAREHRSHPFRVPPALPLLVLLAIAAEQMQADEDLAAHNYYARLHRLLRVPAGSHARVENNYRQTADVVWGSLNSWLEAWEGERGIPTAYAVGAHAYIGLPMSQAVVRRHDRSGLHELFAIEGMTPGLRISPVDMSMVIEPYASATPSWPLSNHLSRLWRVPAARERIVDAACLELEAWDGSGLDAATSARPIASTRLLAFLRTFPRKTIEFNLMLPYRSEQPDIARFRAGDQETILPTISGPGGSTRLSGVQGVLADSLIGEQLEGEFGDYDSRPFVRRPKRVTPLRWDDLQGAFVEVERISLGEDSLVLARSEAKGRVEAFLSAHARPGWVELVDLPGAPEGWLLYQHVQILSAPSTSVHFDLLPLSPRARTSLTLRGGFVLPGLLRKWSVLQPPEVVALAAGASSVAVRVYSGARIVDDAIVAETTQLGELVVLPLDGYRLSDGEYLVAMFVDGAGKPSSTALLRLRSADTPQFRVEDVDIRLVYSPASNPRWPLTAGPADWPGHVNGARIVDLADFGVVGDSVMREFTPRAKAKSAPTGGRLRVGVPVANDSCVVTGMHHFLLPPSLPGRPLTRTIEGECTTCGLVRRFAATPWAAKKKDESDRPVVIADIPSIVESKEPDFEVAFDALNHVGTGSFGVFERIAAQVEGSGLFADSFLRRLEVVGHVDVARDDYFTVIEWAVNKTTLVPIDDGRWVLIGSRSRALLKRIQDMAGNALRVNITVDAELSRVEVAGALPIEELVEAGVSVLEMSPAMAIAMALPPLSDVAASLRRIAVPHYRSAEYWDTTSASWLQVETLAEPGAYRLKDFSSIYGIRTVEDIADGTIGIGNAQVVKHISNMWSGDPLVGYNMRSGSVVTPLGADLPALYGRALALCTGRAPREIVEHRILQYPSVPRAVADVIFDRLSR